MTTLTPELASSYARTYGMAKSAPVSEMKAGVKIGIFAPGGIGKTTLVGTLCDSDFGWPVCYINARGNPHVISSRGEKVQVFDVEKFKDVEGIRQGLLNDKNMPFKTVVIDNVTELWSMDLRDLYGATADIDWTKHSASTADILQVVRNFCDLADAWPRINVVFVFQETPEEREIAFKKVQRSELMLNKALQSQVPTILNWVGRLYIVDENEPFRRKLDFRPIEALHVAKHQIDPADEFARQIPMEQWNPSLGAILDTLKGRQPFPTQNHDSKSKPVGV